MSAIIRRAPRALAGLAALLLLLSGPAVAGDGAKVFDTAEGAAEAIIAAAAANDDAALQALYGPESADLILDGKDPIVAKDRARFVEAAKERLLFEKQGDDRAVLVVGKNEWPLPVPIVRKDGKWSFDAEAGREEILARRIGRNEIEAIAICRAYALAQLEYARSDRDGDQVREYAQKLISTEGQKDGLYWPAAADEEVSPFGPMIAPLEEFRTAGSKQVPFNGYYWRILREQGPNAPGQAHSYVINGNMIAGFALVGVPAQYMNTGVMTFLVSHHGKVLEKDLGENSLEIVKAMMAFDPDDTWTEPSITD